MLNKKEILEILTILRDVSSSEEARKEAWQQFNKCEEDIKAFLDDNFVTNALMDDDSLVEDVYKSIQLRLFTKDKRTPKKSTICVFLKKYSVVAILLLFLGALGIYLCLNKSGYLPIKHSEVARTIKAGKLSLQYDTILNNSTKNVNYCLSDGSIATLTPNSFIYFRKDFQAEAKRILYLRGSGIFHVNSIKTSAFSVYVNDLEVQDFGTIFSIYSANTTISIKLLKGKISVKSLDTSSSMTPILLRLDQELLWNTIDKSFRLKSAFIQNNKLNYRKNKVLDIDSIVATNNIEFHNTPLRVVLDSIKAMFNGVNILYTENFLLDKTFTGAIGNHNTLKSILTRICLINNMCYTVQQNEIHIMP